METRLDPKKVQATSKARNSSAIGLRRKVTAPTFVKQAAAVITKREVPQLTPLHRLQRFKAIRDKNLKSKGFKISLDTRFKKMEEINTTTTTTTTVEIKEKLSSKETLVEEVEFYETKGEESAKVLENGNSEENGHEDKNGFSKEDEEIFSSVEEKIVGNEKVVEEEQFEVMNTEPSVDLDSVQGSITESNLGNQEVTKITESNLGNQEVTKLNSESMSESEAVSSISPQHTVSNSNHVETDDEEVEVVQSKPEYESSSKINRPGTSKKENAENLYTSNKIVNPSSKGLFPSSGASSHRSSYSSFSKIYGRRPVHRLAGSSRKRKLEEESVKNCDFKRINNSPSQPSPRWRFLPTSMNFWTPRTTPFVFPASTPMNSLNDSMAVNVNEDTIRSNLEDSDLFSDAEEFKSLPPIKSRWGCVVM